MSTTALGIAPDEDGSGVTPLTHRRIIERQWENTGVVDGLETDTTSTTSYTVDAGLAVCSNGSSDGYTLAYSEGGTVSTSSNSSANSRYDVLWIKANDLDNGDDDNHVELGITKGSTASSPSIPSVSTGCTPIATYLVPGGMTATNECEFVEGETQYAIPYGARTGNIASYSSAKTGKVSTSSTQVKKFYNITVPTDRLVELKWSIRMMYGEGSYDASSNTGGNTGDDYAGCFVSVYVDGDLVSTGMDCITVFNNPTRQVLFYDIALEAGTTHTIECKTMARTDGIYWAGVCGIFVMDMGPYDPS